jgi:uncharacterized protein with PQ loop repeat
MTEKWIAIISSILGLILTFLMLVDRLKKFIKNQEAKKLLWTILYFCLSIAIVAFLFHSSRLEQEMIKMKSNYNELILSSNKDKLALEEANKKIRTYEDKVIEKYLTLKNNIPVTTCRGDIILTFDGNPLSYNFGKLFVGGVDLKNGKGYVTYDAKPGLFYPFTSNGSAYRINILYYQNNLTNDRCKDCVIEVVRDLNWTPKIGQGG